MSCSSRTGEDMEAPGTAVLIQVLEAGELVVLRGCHTSVAIPVTALLMQILQAIQVPTCSCRTCGGCVNLAVLVAEELQYIEGADAGGERAGIPLTIVPALHQVSHNVGLSGTDRNAETIVFR